MAAIFASRRLPGRVPAQVCMVSRAVDDPLELRNCRDGSKSGTPTSRIRRGQRRSGYFGGLVHAPHLPQGVADLSDGRLSAQRLAQGDEHVLRAGRGLPEVVDPPLPLPGVAGGAQPREPLRLVALDRRVYAQRLIRLVTGRDELVYPDQHPLAVIDLAGDLVGRALDLGLLEAAL